MNPTQPFHGEEFQHIKAGSKKQGCGEIQEKSSERPVFLAKHHIEHKKKDNKKKGQHPEAHTAGVKNGVTVGFPETAGSEPKQETDQSGRTRPGKTEGKEGGGKGAALSRCFVKNKAKQGNQKETYPQKQRCPFQDIQYTCIDFPQDAGQCFRQGEKEKGEKQTNKSKDTGFSFKAFHRKDPFVFSSLYHIFTEKARRKCRNFEVFVKKGI